MPGIPAVSGALAVPGMPVTGAPDDADVQRRMAQELRRRKLNKALPAILIGGSFGGIALIMAGLLAILSPEDPVIEGPSGPYTTPMAQVEPGALPPTVGPGGPDVPLTAAAPTAPPPIPAVVPVDPIVSTGAVVPAKLVIPQLGVSAPLRQVGVLRSGEVQVPPLSQPKVAGWYKLGPVPGQPGPAVILGHVTTRRGPAVFSRLREVRRGNKIQVVRTDGSVAEFTVDGVEQVSKNTFPTKRVYGSLDTAGLRLITCGGVYNRKTGHYTDNIIVYATLSATKNA
ncbi:class F sortase [Acrocarpospora catenulata]|uniref:class F sortase n=1 Tax=Acrocarpospora catenulata TaxID=2836182 RepID=UPI002023AC81|nr:class F sortase [Acrocarpospora catenulata]